MTVAASLPNPFNFGQPEPPRFVLDEDAFMAAIEPLPIFLRRAAPVQQSRWIDWLHELGDLASC